MLNYVKKLRGQPEHKRRRVAFIVALVATLIITGVWGTSVGFWTFVRNQKPGVAQYEKTPLDSMEGQVAGAFSSIKTGFDVIKHRVVSSPKIIQSSTKQQATSETVTTETGEKGIPVKITKITVN